MRASYCILTLTLLLVGCVAFAQEEAGKDKPLEASTIVEKSQLAFYYQGADMKARVTMELIDRNGGKRTRVITMLRRDEKEGGNQKYLMYFHEPGDVRGMAFMVWKYPKKEDDRWIFIPAVDLIRRIAADDKRSSFVGSDFTYEDVSGRDVDFDTHAILREEKSGDRDCYVIQSVPRAATDYTKRLSWIDKENFLPLKEEYYDIQKELSRVFIASEIKDVVVGEGKNNEVFPTAMKRTIKNVKTGHRTEVMFTLVSYNLGLDEKDFTERRMRRPPLEWTR